MDDNMKIKQGNLKIFIGDSENSPLAFMSYTFESENVIVIHHTFVTEELRGQNIAHHLMEYMIALVKKNKWLVIPKCSYVVAQFQKYSEYQPYLFKN